MGYGIYTGGDRRFYPGLVAAVNALRHYGCEAPIAIFDLGLTSTMRRRLASVPEVRVLDMRPVIEAHSYVDSDVGNPVLDSYGFKVFGILHYSLFDSFTYFDADFLPLCNLETHLLPQILRGELLMSEDGVNHWTESIAALVNGKSGSFINFNAGFFSMSLVPFRRLLVEWGRLMSRRAVTRRMFTDQGPLNAAMNGLSIQPTSLNPYLWNQTWVSSGMAAEGLVIRSRDRLVYAPSKERICSWHGCGVRKLWHLSQVGPVFENRVVDAWRSKCEPYAPKAVIEIFKDFYSGELLN